MYYKLICLFLLMQTLLFAQREPVIPKENSNLKFTQNLGQWNNTILYRAQLDGGQMFLETNAITFNLYDKVKYRALHHGGILNGENSDANIKGHSYQINFQNCNTNVLMKAEGQGLDYENFFLGNDPNKWKSKVNNFKKVWYSNLYNGIDYEILSAANTLKYNFHVKPAADINLIQLKYTGVTNLKLVNNTLTYSLSVNEVIEQKPFAYQIINGRVIEVNCIYTLNKNVVGFEFPKGYNSNYELIIDPLLIFAAQSGSTADNFGMTATWDAQGNFYSGGTAFDIGYPYTLGAYSNIFNGPAAMGNTDIVISKYNSLGNSLLYSTYFGGSQSEIVTSLIVDHSNNLCFYGATGSANFPTTSGAFDNSFNGGNQLNFTYNGTNFINGTDIYVAKFNSAGNLLLGSTFLGGSNNDGVNHVNGLTLINPSPPTYEYVVDSIQHNYGDQYRGEIQVDQFDNIYIASSSRSADFPVQFAIDNTLGGLQDAVVCKFNPSLTQLLFSTFLGGSSNDCGNSLIVNSNQEVYVTGGTCSQNFPTSGGVWQNIYGGGVADGYISKINTVSPVLMASTYIGTNSYDQCYFIQSDLANNIYVYGQSLGNMPVIGPVYNNAGRHQFISKLNANLTIISMSTVFGNNLSDTDISPSAFSVDVCNNIYVSGWGGSILVPNTPMSNMPLMAPIQSTTNGYDFYLMELSPDAGSLLFGTYFGGNLSSEHVDGGTSRIDKAGVYYQSVCAGCAGNDDFPVTPGAWPNIPGNPNQSFNCNNGVFKIKGQNSITTSNIQANTTLGCTPLTVSLSNASVNYSTYLWHLAPGITNSVNLNPSITYTAAGVYTISLVVQNPGACNVKDSSVLFINVSAGPAPTLNIVSSGSVICAGFSATLNALGANSYSWSNNTFGANNIITPSVSTTYTLTGSNINGCTSNMVYTQSVVICTGLNETENKNADLSIFPNPNSGFVKVLSNQLIEKLILTNTLGEQFYLNENINTNYAELNLEHLAKGIYFISIKTNKEISIVKIIKE